MGQDYLVSRGKLGNLYWLANDKAFRDACNTCHHFIDEAVLKAMEKEGKEDVSYVFIESLVRQTRDPQVLRDQCLNMMLIGRDTMWLMTRSIALTSTSALRLQERPTHSTSELHTNQKFSRLAGAYHHRQKSGPLGRELAAPKL